MVLGGFDPEILQDFLTESGELLDALERDLVSLERAPQDPELLNRAFRALHTIKGSASFLALTNLVRIAHAAESALNAARNGQVAVDRAMMDLLLQAVDLIKRQMAQIQTQQELAEPPAALVDQLAALGEGKAAASAAAAPAAPAEGEDPVLKLPSGREDLLDYFVDDMEEAVGKIAALAPELAAGGSRASTAGGLLVELGEALAKTADFFEFRRMHDLVVALNQLGRASGELGDGNAAGAAVLLTASVAILRDQAVGLRAKRVREGGAGALVARIDALVKAVESGEEAPDLDLHAVAADPTIAAATAGTTGAALSGAVAVAAPQAAPDAGSGAPAAGGEAAPKQGDEDAARRSTPEQTIRVEVGRLETLMNLVGELVLQKNRIASIVRGLSTDSSGERLEQLGLASGGLERVTADIQIAVMRTRMQPLDKIFSKYPRLIRDLARKTGKQMELVIEGGDTEVDKSVIEELGDPLVHLMRNSADHGLESPEERSAAGKSAQGVIKLSASHEGSHVCLVVADDGRGLSRERIAKKAVERGLVKAEAVAAMSDRDVFQFVFLPGFSTAEAVSDLSGRGVGMDVVRTNIAKIKGTIELTSTAGKGTQIAIKIPLTVAIMPAMMVEVSKEIYAIPLTNILEIVRPDPAAISTIGESPVMRLRDRVLPLIRAHDLIGAAGAGEPAPFTVVLSMADKRVGLMVTRLIGQQEIVIKPLEGVGAAAAHGRRAMSGATVRDDGGVSLIVDVAELVRMAESRRAKAA